MNKNEYIKKLIDNNEIDADILSGEVYSFRTLNGRLTNTKRKINGRITNGYRSYLIHTENGRKSFRCHRIVWTKANGIIPNDMCICHLNNIKLDNRINNLYIATGEQNSTDAANDGLYRTAGLNPATKLNNKIVKKIRNEYKNKRSSYRMLGRKYNVSKSLIGAIINNNIWKKNKKHS